MKEGKSKGKEDFMRKNEKNEKNKWKNNWMKEQMNE